MRCMCHDWILDEGRLWIMDWECWVSGCDAEQQFVCV